MANDNVWAYCKCWTIPLLKKKNVRIYNKSHKCWNLKFMVVLRYFIRLWEKSNKHIINKGMKVYPAGLKTWNPSNTEKSDWWASALPFITQTVWTVPLRSSRQAHFFMWYSNTLLLLLPHSPTLLYRILQLETVPSLNHSRKHVRIKQNIVDQCWRTCSAVQCVPRITTHYFLLLCFVHGNLIWEAGWVIWSVLFWCS